MSEPVVISLQVGGVADVKRAFQAVSDLVVKSAQQSARAALDGDRAVVKSAQASAKEKERAAKQAQKAAETAEKLGVKAVTAAAKEKDKLAKQSQKTAETAEKQKARAAEQAAKAQVRAWLKGDREIEQMRARGVREFERDEAKKTRAVEREAKKRAAAEERTVKAGQRAREDFAKATGSKVGGAVSSVMGGAARLAGAALTLGGGFGIADSAAAEMKAGGMAADIANSGSLPGGKQFTSKEVLAAAREQTARHGFSDEESLKALQNFTSRSGDLQAGMGSLGKLAELSRASGTDMGELGDVAGKLRGSGQAKDDKQMMQMLRVFAGQGQKGSVELRDMASVGGRLLAASSQLGAKTDEDRNKNLATVGAMAQVAVAKGGAVDSAEAATSASRFMSDVSGNEKRFRAMGVKTTENGVVRDPQALIQDVLAKTKGDTGKIQGLFGDQSAKSVLGFASVYRDAENEKKGSGSSAVEAEFSKFIKAAASEEEVRAAAAKRTAEADVQLETAMNSLRTAVGREVVPQVLKLVPVIRDATPHIAKLMQSLVKLAEWAEKNPLEAATAGLGVVIAGALTKEIASAAIGKAASSAISVAMGSASFPPAAGIMIAAALVLLMKEAFDKEMARKVETQTKNAFAYQDADKAKTELQRKLSSGEALTPEEIASAQKTLVEGRAKVDTMKKGEADEKEMDKSLAVGLRTATLGLYDGGFNEANADKQKAAAASTKRTEDSLNELASALAKATEAAKANAAANNGGKANPNDPSRSAPLSSGARGGTQ
ncbi:MAG: hypothetical protein HOO96_14050 [Polyangiaceae bacterium]|nr:hypothetical protein [Polyangiaceae bacterium]